MSSNVAVDGQQSNAALAWTAWCGSVGVVAAPNPHERIRQCLLENAAVAVARGQAKYEAVVVTLGFESSRGAFAGHHPVVMGLLRIVRAKIVFGNMREDAQRFLLAAFNELHAGVVFPRAKRIFGFLRRVVILLIDECARIGDQTTE